MIWRPRSTRSHVLVGGVCPGFVGNAFCFWRAQKQAEQAAAKQGLMPSGMVDAGLNAFV